MAESETRRKIRERLAAGLTVREIARGLDLSTQEVNRQRRAIEGRQTENDRVRRGKRKAEPAVSS